MKKIDHSNDVSRVDVRFKLSAIGFEEARQVLKLIRVAAQDYGAWISSVDIKVSAVARNLAVAEREEASVDGFFGDNE